MCGILGFIAKEKQKVATPLILEGLKRLEYRGYDSAGIATLHQQQINICKRQGKIRNLEQSLYQMPLLGNIGIGHTRWATHGIPSHDNSHPHASENIVLVHNGIIENYAEIKQELLEKHGYNYVSDTDTESVAHLIDHHYKQSKDPLASIKQAIDKIKGSFALAIFFKDIEALFCAKRNSPLVIALGNQENEGAFIASDPLAISGLTNKIIYLQEHDYAQITADSIMVYNDGEQVSREVKIQDFTRQDVEKGDYRHFMEKEIHEQPLAIRKTLQALWEAEPNIPFAIDSNNSIRLIACGTSYHAAMIARYWFEELAGVRCSVEMASEARYRITPTDQNEVTIVISQSGETADTLACLQHIKKQGCKVYAIVNVPTSTIARQADAFITTHAGPEIGVASTKAFTTQLVALLSICCDIKSPQLTSANISQIKQELFSLPVKIQQVLDQADAVESVAQKFFSQAKSAIYIGRGADYPLALEGALKLKEISYIHAEGLPAGELKHGSIALIDEHLPTVALVSQQALYEKTLSNIREVIARKGKVIIFASQKFINQELLEQISEDTTVITIADDMTSYIAPILYSIPIQFLAYFVALQRGTDIDQPRNLAKSVTVE